MPGRVGVHAEVLGVRRIGQTTGAESQHLPFRLVNVVHLDVEVKLRMRRVGPLWRDVVRSQLDREADVAALEGRPVVRSWTTSCTARLSRGDESVAFSSIRTRTAVPPLMPLAVCAPVYGRGERQ